VSAPEQVDEAERTGPPSSPLDAPPKGFARFKELVDELGAPQMVVPPPTTGPGRRLPFFIKQVVDTFAQKNASRMAGAIAYFGIFSFAPLLIVAVLVAGSLLRSGDARDIIIERLGEFVSPIVADAVGQLLEAVARPDATTIAGVVSGVALFFGASSVFIHVQMSLDDIFEAARRHRNGFIGMVLRRVVAFAAAIGIGLLVAAAVLSNLAVQTLDDLVLERWLPDEWEAGAVSVLSAASALALLVVVFAVVFQYMSTHRAPWRAVLAGAALTTALVAAGTQLFALFLGQLSFVNIYGAASFLLVLLLYFYYLSMILLFGAAFVRVLGDRVLAFG
jgi:membrane protein